MNLTRQLNRALMSALPPDRQKALARDFVEWLYRDRPPDKRQETSHRVTPHLIQWLHEGKIGLWTVLRPNLTLLSLARVLGFRAELLDGQV